uniref:Uncharacterized protein n=1 Tax=Branchiostoma floridae TaxID=7739 RepID=C3YRM1_BRAFL|eukprot:XP_002601206.1 hypothetical protein BRAFLDRAFT_75650 [Branchiostoma floridae]
MAQQTPDSPAQIPQPNPNNELGPAGPNGRHPAQDDPVRLAAMANWPRDYIYPFRDVPAPEQEPNNDLDAKNSPSGSNEPQLAHHSPVHVAEMPNWPQDYIYPFRDVPAPEEEPNNDPETTGPNGRAPAPDPPVQKRSKVARGGRQPGVAEIVRQLHPNALYVSRSEAAENGLRGRLTRAYGWIEKKTDNRSSTSRLEGKTSLLEEHPNNNSAKADHPDNHASTADHLLNNSRLEDKVSALEDRLDNHSALNILLEDHITSLENQQKNDRERNSRLGDQVSTLEKRLSSQSALVSRLNGQVSTLEKQRKNHSIHANLLQDRVATLEEQRKNDDRTQGAGLGNQRATIEQHSGLLKSIQTRISSFGKNLQDERKLRIQLEEAVAQLTKGNTDPQDERKLRIQLEEAVAELPTGNSDLPKGAENGGSERTGIGVGGLCDHCCNGVGKRLVTVNGTWRDSLSSWRKNASVTRPAVSRGDHRCFSGDGVNERRLETAREMGTGLCPSGPSGEGKGEQG